MAQSPQHPRNPGPAGASARRSAAVSVRQRSISNGRMAATTGKVPQNFSKPRPMPKAGSKSIRNKLTLVMSGVAATILLVIFFFTYQLTSSTLGEEITRNGVSQVQSRRVTGRLFVDKLNESALLARLDRLRSEEQDHEVTKAFATLKSHWAMRHNSGIYQPAKSYPRVIDLHQDLLWMSVANALDAVAASKEIQSAILGQDYQSARSNPERGARWLKTGWEELKWPSEQGLVAKDFSAKAASEVIHKAMHRLLLALVEDTNVEVAQILKSNNDAKGREASSQILGFRYTPSENDFGWLHDLGKAPVSLTESEQATLREAAQVEVGALLNATENSLPSTMGGIVYFEGELEVASTTLPVREFVFGADGGEEVRVLLNTTVLEEARTETITTLTLVAMAGLILAIGVSVILGIAIARPIQELMQDVSRIASGDFDYRPPVRTKDEVGTLARLVGEMAGSLSVGQQMWQENQASRHDVSMAKEIQDNLLPSVVPEIPGYDIGVYYEPSKEVGGDYYDFFEIDQDNLGMVCADVSGKGIPGSMVMMMAKALITNNARHSYSPRDVFIQTNQVLAKDIKRGMFVTAYYAVLDATTRELRVASAGHNAMLIYRSSTGEMLNVNPSGIALGFDRDGALFEKNVKEEIVELRIGDRVVIYTDGVTEATNPGGEEFGEERLKAAMQGYGQLASNDFLFRLVSEIEGFAQSENQHDDITIVTFMVQA